LPIQSHKISEAEQLGTHRQQRALKALGAE